MFRRLIIATVAIIATFGLVAPSASAWSLSYVHKVTRPTSGDTACGGVGSTTANLEVEAYNVRQTNGTIARVYKVDLDGDVRSANLDLRSYRVYIGGKRLSGTNNVTVKYQDQDLRRTITGEWRMGACIWRGKLYKM